jgi:hypothetical protein
VEQRWRVKGSEEQKWSKQKLEGGKMRFEASSRDDEGSKESNLRKIAPEAKT